MDWGRGRHDGVGGEKQQSRYCQDVQPNGKCLRFGRGHGVEDAIGKPMLNWFVYYGEPGGVEALVSQVCELGTKKLERPLPMVAALKRARWCLSWQLPQLAAGGGLG